MVSCCCNYNSNFWFENNEHVFACIRTRRFSCSLSLSRPQPLSFYLQCAVHACSSLYLIVVVCLFLVSLFVFGRKISHVRPRELLLLVARLKCILIIVYAAIFIIVGFIIVFEIICTHTAHTHTRNNCFMIVLDEILILNESFKTY